LTHDNFPDVKKIYKKLTRFESSFSELKFTTKDTNYGRGIKNAHKQMKFDLRTKEDYWVILFNGNLEKRKRTDFAK
jgi:hypothetical protein